MRPVAAAKEPGAAADVEDGMKVSQGLILTVFVSTNDAETTSSAS